MKKILSIASVALFTFSLVFTACRNDAGTQQQEQTEQPAAAPAPAAADTTAAQPAPADTTQQAQ
jgi:hypothetical protein